MVLRLAVGEHQVAILASKYASVIRDVLPGFLPVIRRLITQASTKTTGRECTAESQGRASLCDIAD
jgi:hypothetical protein